MTQSVFAPATRHTLDLIAARNRAGAGSYLTGSNFINPEAAKLAHLLCALAGPGERYCYLVSSAVEALSGVINLARHTAVRAKSEGGWVLLLDPDRRWSGHLDPLGAGPRDALFPHAVTVGTVAEIGPLTEADPGRWAAVVVPAERAGDPALADAVRDVRTRGALLVVCALDREPGDPELFADPLAADVLVFGENLAGRQVPFGAFVMTAAANAVWRNDTDAFAHTSTFGGNALCAAVVLDGLERAGSVDADRAAVLASIDADPAAALEHWGRSVKPNIAALAATFGLHVPIASARGGRLVTADGREVIDCIGGSGANLRGHNPPDLVPDVLEAHDPAHDHVADLAAVLAELTGLPEYFGSVSGAVANDTAVTLAALARPDRRRVVTFDGNFAGKSLFSVNLSRRGPQRSETEPDAFRPYYPHVVYVDPFGADAVTRFTDAVRGGDVALVWFELVQGAACRALPAELVRAVDALRAEHGYLVGIDEVLTGGWRSGEHYLAHEGVLSRADVVTVGKTLSDMTVPAAAVLASAEVVEAATRTDPEQVAAARGRFRHQLGAHIAVHALRAARDEASRARSRRAYADLVSRLDVAFGDSAVFGPVAGQGAHLRLTLGSRWFPASGPMLGLLEFVVSDLVYRRCGVFLPLLRILHRVQADPDDLAELARRLEIGTRGLRLGTVYRYALASVLRAKAPGPSRWLTGRAADSRL